MPDTTQTFTCGACSRGLDTLDVQLSIEDSTCACPVHSGRRVTFAHLQCVHCGACLTHEPFVQILFMNDIHREN